VRRRGFTLMELVLVMALMVIAASLIAPVVDSMMNPNQVAASVDAVRSIWMEARGRAMEEGRPYRFSVQENSGKFKIEPDDQDEPGAEAGASKEGDLPSPCAFVESGEAIMGNAGGGGGGEWKSIAIFLPDGTARDDAKVHFGRQGLPTATLKLRALTGTISQDSGADKEGTP